MTPPTPQQKQLARAPHVTAVVVRSGSFEAQIGADSGIVISHVGPQGGRYKELTLTASEAGALLDLVAHGRAALQGMVDAAETATPRA